MKIRIFPKRAKSYVFVNFMLVILLILSNSLTVKAADSVLSEIRALLQTQYVNPVSSAVLKAPTVEEMLKRLGDPHTTYFSAEQYQDFIGSIDMSFAGIGIYIDLVPEGVEVLSVMSGSPAEEVGIIPGNVIIRADGRSLAGLSSEEAMSVLRGPEGSTVEISVKQGEEIRDITVVRRVITTPTVTGEVLGGHIGYVDLNSFGSDTSEEFESVVNQLRGENIDGWIVDLRDNGGGYLSSAIDIAGYFIGSDVLVQIKDRTGEFRSYEASTPSFTLDKPIICLTNENSASASELLAAAVRDYQKASLVGATTYGKGTVQSLFPLKNGGVLKMTVSEFFSPLKQAINKVGVSPDVEIQQADSLKAAELMLSNDAAALELGRTDDYWEAWQEIAGINSPSELQPGFNYPYYYPSYRSVGELQDIPLAKKFTVHFSGMIDMQSVNSTSIELINSETGERTPATFESLSPSDVQVIPKDPLTPDTTYWLVIHPSILGVSGQVLQAGGVAVAHTIQGAEAVGSAEIQSLRIRDHGYGIALWDIGERRSEVTISE